MKKALFIFLILPLLSGCLSRIPSVSTDRYAQDFVDSNQTAQQGGIHLTYLGVSTLLIDDGQTQLMIDGFFSRFSLLHYLTKKVQTDTTAVQEMLQKHRINRLKHIFVTHSHFDHAMDAPYVAEQTGAMLHGSASTLEIGVGAGLDAAQMKEFELRKAFKAGTFTIEIFPSLHAPIFEDVNDMSVNTIEEPLPQPTKGSNYLMGGAFDFLITHGKHRIFIRPSANFQEGQLEGTKADVFMMGIAGMTKVKEDDFVEKYYAETVSHLHPKLVIPIHWDNFFRPYKEGKLKFLPWIYERKLGKGLDKVKEKLAEDGIEFKMMQGGSEMVLFGE